MIDKRKDLRMWRYGLVLLSLCVLFSCTKSPEKQKQVQNHVTKKQKLASFNKINVQASIDVALRTGAGSHSVVLRGDARDLEHVHFVVEDGQLNISNDGYYPRFGTVKATVNSRHLNRLDYHGTGTLSGRNLKTGLIDINVENHGKMVLSGSIGLRHLRVKGEGYTKISGLKGRELDVLMIGQPKVHLSGMAGMKSIKFDGKGWLGFYWVNSRNLKVRGNGQAYIQLAGFTDRLDVELRGRSRFNGQYLRAKRGFVRTFDRSIAKVNIINKQHTIATDQSNIYFFNNAKMGADFMAYDGSVLDMREAYHFASNDYHGYRRKEGYYQK
jgi:Putative auto-transporter adhesin, head GIN domain